MMLPRFFKNAWAIGYTQFWMFSILSIQLVAVVFEGISIGAILPILQFVEKGGEIETLLQESPLWEYLVVAAKTMGVPLSLPTLLTGAFALIVCRQCFVYLREVFSSWIQLEVIRNVRNRAFDGFMHAELSYNDGMQAGRFVNELTTELPRAASSITTGITFISILLSCIVYGFVVLLLSPSLTIVSFAVLMLVAVLLIRLMRRIHGLGFRITNANQDLSAFLFERLKSIRLVRLSNIEAAEFKSLKEHTERQRAQLFEQRRLMSLLSVLIEPMVLAIALTLFYFAVTKLTIEFSEILLFFFILLRMAPLVKEAIVARQSYLGQIASIEVVGNRLKSLEEGKADPGGPRELTALKNLISLKNVQFSYPDTSEKALNGMNLDVPAAGMLAIVGPSGAGKSTLVDCLPRLRTPSSGEILFDGIPQKEFSVTSLRKAISFVPQTPQIFNVTVSEHIRFGLPTASDEDVRWAARVAQADEFIQKMPEGYDTVLGESGIRLSGGQRQRLDLARALVRRAPILVLDEPTSNLDPNSEAKFLIALEVVRSETPTTLVIIAHRLSTVRMADQIAVMEDGVVTSIGTHDTLMESDGWYGRAFGNSRSLATIPNVV
jgi:ABC-type multidrug transport system fused ATPase/permease subunit